MPEKETRPEIAVIRPTPIAGENSGQSFSRRKFLSGLLTNRTQETGQSLPKAETQSPRSERNMVAFLEEVGHPKFSRRQILLKLGMPMIALVADQILTKGKLLYYGIQLLTNQKFRDKLFEAIKTGEISEDLEQLERSLRGEIPPNFELGRKIESDESWLNDSFSSQEIRLIHNTESGETRTILVADIGRVEIIQAIRNEIGPGIQAVNFSQTATANGPFATLPTSQQSLDSKVNSWISSLYSAYQFQSEVVEYLDSETGNFNPRGGALVVIDNQLIVVDSSQLSQYQVGKNCQAIEVMSFVIRSNHLKQDLRDMTESGSLAATDMINDPRYNAFVATFYDINNLPQTLLISTYYQAANDVRVSEWKNDDRLTVARALDLFEQIREERGYTHFEMQVPDPDFSLVTSSFSVNHPAEIADVSAQTALGERFNWQYHRILNEQKRGFARINGRRYFLAVKK